MKTLLLIALAQTQPVTKAPARAQVTTYVFGGDHYTAETCGPDGVVADVHGKAQFGSIILVRQDFRTEVLRSVSEVK